MVRNHDFLWHVRAFVGAMRVLIGFSTSQHLLSRVIRRVTGSTVSHVWLLYRDPVFRIPVVLQAGLIGLAPMPADRFWRENEVVCVKLPVVDLTPGLERAGLLLGARYDFPGLFGAALPFIGRWFKMKWRNPFRGAQALFCSEVVALVLKWSGTPGTARLSADDSSPASLLSLESAWAPITVDATSPDTALGGLAQP